MSQSTLWSERPLLYKRSFGMLTSEIFPDEHINSSIRYKPLDDDIFLCAYPKAGSHWLEFICFLILNEGRVPTPLELLLDTPLLEAGGLEGIECMKRPGILRTHMPYHLTPKNTKAKYIVVTRNPKDSCVSFYHHTKGLDFYNYSDGTFEHFFEQFITGNVDFGDYFDYVVPWHQNVEHLNILYLNYEQCIQNAKQTILEIATFFGEKYIEKLKTDPTLLSTILKESTISNMKKSQSNYNQCEKINRPIPQYIKKILERPKEKSFEFLRKGINGDYKEYFTEEMNERLNKKIDQRLKGTQAEHLITLWKNVNIL